MPTTLPIPAEELAAWLRLGLARGLRPAALRALLGAFGLPQNVLAQPFAALAAVAGAQAAHAALAEPRPDFAAQLEALQAWRAGPGNALITLADPAYPARLLDMPDPPPLLYAKGRLELLHASAVAVVGSRNATPQAVEDAARFARILAASGLTVVSGLALGVDGAAHRGALHEQGGTVAVIGTGADLVYPPAHHPLAMEIAVHGALVSEWPLGTPARSANFPQRNRVIAALVEGVVVVEAAQRSGSLITARLANEMGRDVFALPGSIHAPLTRGCHGLIKQGAQLVESPEEVLDALNVGQPPGAGRALASLREQRRQKVPVPFDRIQRDDTSETPQLALEFPRPEPPPAHRAEARKSLASLGAEARCLLEALGHAPATVEILAQRTDMAEAVLQGTLLQLELAGHVDALPGGWFVRASRG
ncbi:DNA-processing protein DprA [Paraburkholderia sp. CNPSo 3076]|uniref:DNA-processing protein DprA n=1 Tax=Paraburkholderia sp. CNPSo 3076 TaxID=2940936 RepID=UPI0022542638|nr:DNA-processing protein DprA [Paraburkholderia sp. CNPSo 3076]MCX5542888.1 DNA-processing protein DprA [Paraburkholderia sp. CNPSo 3076]